jgi:hypothetical protein
MLEGQHRAVLPEWLAALAAVRRRVPEERLPDLLELGQRDRGLRSAILPVLGRRGYWLAAQNPDWSWAVGGDAGDETTWQVGAHEARYALLRHLRSTDPDRARELVLSTWSQEMPAVRATILSMFRIGLSMADEPFLEQALEDRYKQARMAAADVLARLPESRLCRRMGERVQPLLSVTRERLAVSIRVHLPEVCDAAAVRDGIEPRGVLAGLGEKADWLAQMLGAVPPSYWCRQWNRTPAQIVQAALKGEWKEALLLGWSRAAARSADAEWAEALLAAWLEEPNSEPFFATWEELAGVPPAERLEALTLPLLGGDRSPLAYNHLATLLEHLAPWSVRLTRAALEHARRRMRARGTRSDPFLGDFLQSAARSIPPAMVDEVVGRWPTEAEEWSLWAKTVDECLALLQFRHDMLKEITA